LLPHSESWFNWALCNIYYHYYIQYCTIHVWQIHTIAWRTLYPWQLGNSNYGRITYVILCAESRGNRTRRRRFRINWFQLNLQLHLWCVVDIQHSAYLSYLTAFECLHLQVLCRIVSCTAWNICIHHWMCTIYILFSVYSSLGTFTVQLFFCPLQVQRFTAEIFGAPIIILCCAMPSELTLADNEQLYLWFCLSVIHHLACLRCSCALKFSSIMWTWEPIHGKIMTCFTIGWFAVVFYYVWLCESPEQSVILLGVENKSCNRATEQQQIHSSKLYNVSVLMNINLIQQTQVLVIYQYLQ